MIVIFVGIALMSLERVVPDQKLPFIRGWWFRVILLNTLQLGVVILAGFTWEKWLSQVSFWSLPQHLSNFQQAFVAYLIITFVFYWWYRVRHLLDWLWILCHQIHHSPSRIETITSFYKHPFEILLNSIIISVITYPLLGLTLEAAAWVTVLTACAEFFYHMNIRTPHFIGYFIQRPEMHRVHHEGGKHQNNYADLPLWDKLFGTFSNPKRVDHECGFEKEAEQNIVSMLLFKNPNIRGSDE